jgi:hypothetical protein
MYDNSEETVRFSNGCGLRRYGLCILDRGWSSNFPCSLPSKTLSGRPRNLASHRLGWLGLRFKTPSFFRCEDQNK